MAKNNSLDMEVNFIIGNSINKLTATVQSIESSVSKLGKSVSSKFNTKVGKSISSASNQVENFGNVVRDNFATVQSSVTAMQKPLNFFNTALDKVSLPKKIKIVDPFADLKPNVAMNQYTKSIENAHKLTKKDIAKINKEFSTIMQTWTDITPSKSLSPFENVESVPRGKIVSIDEYFNRAVSKKNYAETIKKRNAEIDKSLSRTSARFQRWGMSFLGMLFFGASIQKLGETLIKSTLPMFLQLTESQTSAGQAMTRLSASVDTLKFSFGEAIATALEPMIPVIIEIIDKVREFIEEHPQLGLLAVALYGLGTIMTWIGTVGSGVFGVLSSIITPISKLLIMVGGGASAGASSGAAGGSLSAAFAGLGTILFWLAAIIATVVILWKTNLGGFQEFVTSTFGAVWTTIKNVFMRIWTIVKLVIDFVVALFSGEWGEAFGILIEILKNAVGLIWDLLKGLAAMFYNIFIWIVNTCIDLIMNMVKGIVDILGKGWAAIQKFFGKTQEAEDTLNTVETMKAGIEGFKMDARYEYMNAEDLKVPVIDDWLKTKEEEKKQPEATTTDNSNTTVIQNMTVVANDPNDFQSSFNQELSKYGDFGKNPYSFE